MIIIIVYSNAYILHLSATKYINYPVFHEKFKKGCYMYENKSGSQTKQIC